MGRDLPCGAGSGDHGRVISLILPLLLTSPVSAQPPAAAKAPAAGVTLSRTVGSVDGDNFTSREAALSGLMDRLLAGGKDAGGPTPPESAAGAREQSGLLLEEAVAREADSLNVSAVAETDVVALMQKTEKHMAGRPEWRAFQFTAAEIRRIAGRKLAAKSLIKIKSDSMRGTVSNLEARNYFEKNRVKFGTLPFESFRDNIRSFLAQQQLEEKLRSWFEIIRRKYKVRETRREGEPRA